MMRSLLSLLTGPGTKRRFIQPLSTGAHCSGLTPEESAAALTDSAENGKQVSGTPPGNYTLTLNMTSGNSTHTATLNLVVD
jgi:hypothetical protein